MNASFSSFPLLCNVVRLPHEPHTSRLASDGGGAEGDASEMVASSRSVGPRQQSSPLPSADLAEGARVRSTTAVDVSPGGTLVTASRTRSERLYRKRTKNARLSGAGPHALLHCSGCPVLGHPACPASVA